MTPANRKAGLAVSLLVLAVCLYLLVTASPLLLHTVPDTPGLPFGNLVTWAGVISLVTAVRLGFHDNLQSETLASRVLNAFTRVLLVLAIAWGLVSRGLSGNWRFNFSRNTDSFQGSELASKMFWVYTASIVLLSLLTTVLIFALSIVRSRRQQGR